MSLWKSPRNDCIVTTPLQILYVEDNEIVREITYELLCAPEREIMALGSAEEALAAFCSQPFDVLITDVSLPEMSGLELVRNVLGMKPALPVIIASGYSLEFGLENWGPNVRSIIKPFEGAEIDALISELTRQAAAQS
jgi:two-component system cell cycle response regulator CpdR